jgi:endoglucanase
MKRILLFFLLIGTTLISKSQIDRTAAFERNTKMQKGVNWNGLNFGMYCNMEADIDMKTIHDRGFQSVRIPVEWDEFVDDSYTIESSFFDEVDHAIQAAIRNGLFPYIDIQSWDEIANEPENYYDEFIYLWEQIATHYASWSDSLMFEILNEPAGNLTYTIYNQYQKDALVKIRETNSNRIVLITNAMYSGFSSLSYANIPDDENLIYTLHNYSTHEITHQGLDFLGEYSYDFLGTVWSASTPEYTQMIADIESVKEYSDSFNIPINVGEFGVFTNAGSDTRYRWLNVIANTFQSNNISYAVWDFGSNTYKANSVSTDMFTISKNAWNEPATSAITDDVIINSKSNTSVLFEHDFESGIEPFELTFWNSVDDRVSVIHENGQAKITVSAETDNDWDAHLTYDLDSLDLGHYYAISVDLATDTFRTVTFSSDYSSTSVLVTPTTRRFSNVFRVNNQIEYAPYFRIFVAGNPGTLYIDNFTIEEINIDYVQSLSIDQKDLEIDSLLEKYTLTTTILPTSADEQSVKWSIKENDIATLDEFGDLRPTGAKEGTFWVYATSKDGTNITDSTQITISGQDIGNLKNGDFSKGLTYWQYSWANLYPLITTDSSFYIQTYSVNAYSYQAQVRQNNLRIENGKSYHLSFNAKADATRDIDVGIAMAGDPWTNYFGTTVSLATEWQSYSFDFTMTETTDTASLIYFNFGTSDISWCLDDVKLTEFELEDFVYVTFKVDMQNEDISATGVHLNGSFSNWSEAVQMSEDEGFYYATLKLPIGASIEYKYINGGTTDWEMYEILSGDCAYGNDANRQITVPSADTTLSLVCFASCEACNTSSIKKQQSVEIFVFPNPAKSSVEITNLPVNKDVNIEIYNTNGQLQKEILSKNKSSLLVNLSNMNSGIYVIKIKSNYENETIKFVKTNR